MVFVACFVEGFFVLQRIRDMRNNQSFFFLCQTKKPQEIESFQYISV